MSDCQHIEKDLSALIDGELPDERRAAVLAHLDHCPHCSQRVAELQKLVTGIAALPEAQSPPQFLADVRGKLRRPRTSWVDTLFLPVWWKVPLEAMAVVLLVAVIFAWRQPAPQPTAVVAKAEAPASRVGSPAMTTRILHDEPASNADERRTDHMHALQKSGEVGAVGDGVSAAPGEPTLSMSLPAYTNLDLTKTWKHEDWGRLLATVDANELAITDDTRVAIYYTAARPTETMVITAVDSQAVRNQMDALAKSLHGAVTATYHADERVDKFYVFIPRDKVTQLKASYAQAGTVPSPASAVVARAPIPRRREKVLFASPSPAGQNKDAGTTIVEVQVIPPR